MMPDLFHQCVIKIQIVHDCQPHSQHFFRFEEMTDVCTCMMLAYRTIAFAVDRVIIRFVVRVIDIDDTAPREEVTVASISRRHNAVEQIDTEQRRALHT